MDAPAQPTAPSPPPQAAAPHRSQATIFRKYYTDNDYFVSPEGILKILSALVCVMTSVVSLSAGGCAGAGAGAAALVCGAAAGLLYTGVVCDMPLYAPQAWLFIDVVVSSVMGVLLLVAAVLSMTVCDMNTPLDYLHGPLAIVNAGMVTASAVMTYASAMRLWDAGAAASCEPPLPPREQDA